MGLRQLAKDWWYIASETLAISFPTVGDALLGRVTSQACDARLDHWSRRLVEGTRTTLHFEGQDAVDWSRAYVVMSNHQSIFDIPVLFQAVPGTMRMVTKAELFKVPVWGRAMRDAGFIAIDRSNRERAIASLKVAADQIQRGTHVWIAPEGTRPRDGKLGTLKKGGFMLALETGAPILPIFLDGTRNVMRPNHWEVRKGGEVTVRFGAPISVVGKTCEQLMNEVREYLEAAGRTVAAPLA